MERKNVYVRAREIVRELAPVVVLIRQQDAKLGDQLRRAAQSVVLNIAEGRGNDAGNARLRFATACGSAKEVRAALGVASDWGYVEPRAVEPLDRRLDRVCAITWCLSRKR
ncbi:MAG: four helix bundle protein [Deltaproteobacteria bacterium]|jgi:four helix bundle protein|nr:four helix bundle protein [Deltaproteobacteria bacterium]